MRRCVLGCLVVLFVLAMAGCGTKSIQAEGGSNPLDVKEFMKDYDKEGYGADGKHKGQQYTLRGVVVSKATNHLYLDTGKSAYRRSDQSNRLKAVFAVSQEPALKRIERSDTITFRGRCAGFSVQEGVLFEDCEILK